MAKRSRLQFKKSDFKKAIKGSRGNKLLIAKRVGCDRHTLYSYLDRYPELETLIEQEKKRDNNELMDIARTKLRSDLLKGKAYAVSLTINKLGGQEGFADRRELTVPEGGESPFNLTVIVETDDTPISQSED